MNDSKYVRLYPERAIAPLRILAERLREEATHNSTHRVSVTEHSLDMALRDLDALGFPLDEPLFLLRGQDKLAPATVRHYADQIVLMEGAFGEAGQAASAIEHIRDFADAMELWQPRKLPD